MSDDDTKQTNSDKKRGEKRATRSGRAIDLGKTTDAADADADLSTESSDDDEDEDEGEDEELEE